MQKDKIVLGVVYEINRDEFFSAIESKPALCNDKVIHVSKAEKLGDSLLDESLDKSLLMPGASPMSPLAQILLAAEELLLQ